MLQYSQEQIEERAQREMNRALDEKDMELRRLEEQRSKDEHRFREAQRVRDHRRSERERYHEDSSSESDEQEYLANSGPVMVNASYKQIKHAKELGNGLGGGKSYNQQRANHAISLPSTVSTPPDHCITCGMHKTECSSIGPPYRDSQGQDQCFLRNDLQCQVDMNIVNLDKLKLAALPTIQADLVIAQAAKYGCLRGSNQERLKEYKANFVKFKETLGQAIKPNGSL
jgi:hypothetical protein